MTIYFYAPFILVIFVITWQHTQIKKMQNTVSVMQNWLKALTEYNAKNEVSHDIQNHFNESLIKLLADLGFIKKPEDQSSSERIMN